MDLDFEFEALKAWPGRDVGYCFAVDVFDSQGRYPVRIMIDDVALSRFEREISRRVNVEIIKALYRQELEILLVQGRLRLATPNLVFFVEGGDMQRAKDGDIVIDDICNKLRVVMRTWRQSI